MKQLFILYCNHRGSSHETTETSLEFQEMFNKNKSPPTVYILERGTLVIVSTMFTIQ